MTDKERLGNLNPTIVDNQGNITLKGEDFHWLMEQAERVQELESELNKQIEIGCKFKGEVYDLAKQLTKTLYRTIGILTKTLEGME